MEPKIESEPHFKPESGHETQSQHDYKTKKQNESESNKKQLKLKLKLKLKLEKNQKCLSNGMDVRIYNCGIMRTKKG